MDRVISAPGLSAEAFKLEEDRIDHFRGKHSGKAVEGCLYCRPHERSIAAGIVVLAVVLIWLGGVIS